MSLILLEQGMYTERRMRKFRAMTVKNVCMSMVDSQNRGITFVDDDGTIAIVCFEKDDDDSVLEQIEELSDVLKDEFEYNQRLRLEVLCKDLKIWQFPTMMPDIFWNMKKRIFRTLYRRWGLRTRRKSSGKSMQNCEIS